MLQKQGGAAFAYFENESVFRKKKKKENQNLPNEK
jgi:hypothetical protein